MNTVSMYTECVHVLSSCVPFIGITSCTIRYNVKRERATHVKNETGISYQIYLRCSERTNPGSERMNSLNPGSERTNILNSGSERTNILNPGSERTNILNTRLERTNILNTRLERTNILNTRLERTNILNAGLDGRIFSMLNA